MLSCLSIFFSHLPFAGYKTFVTVSLSMKPNVSLTHIFSQKEKKMITLFPGSFGNKEAEF
jgi:hypothetical protein